MHMAVSSEWLRDQTSGSDVFQKALKQILSMYPVYKNVFVYELFFLYTMISYKKKTNDAELRTEPLNPVWSGLKAVSSLAKVKQVIYALVSFLLKWR